MSDPKVTDSDYLKWLEEVCGTGSLENPKAAGTTEDDDRRMPWESGAEPMSIDDV